GLISSYSHIIDWEQQRRRLMA
ncbi:hypothetical protein MGSAQ_001206, partial [marine sediment metagenome]